MCACHDVLIHRTPRSPPLLTGLSFQTRSPCCSFPVSLWHQTHGLKYLSNDNTPAACRNQLPDKQGHSWTAESRGHLSAINIWGCVVNDKMLQDQLLGTECSSSSTSGRHSAQGPLTESSCASPGSNTGSSPLAAPCCLVFPLWRGNLPPYFALLLDICHLISMKIRGLWSVAKKIMKPDHPSQTV